MSSTTSIQAQKDDNVQKDPLRVGFVGCGTIAVAIATGLATQSKVPIQSIAVTERSVSKSTQLQQDYPELVSVSSDNQEVVDASDIVFLCVRPEQASTVLQQVQLDPNRHQLVSLVALSNLADLEKDSKLPTERVSKMICLTAVAFHQGVCLYCCPTPNPLLMELFESIGGCLSLKTEEQLEVCMLSTTLQGPLFGIMRQNRDWLAERAGLSDEDATYLVVKQYLAMLQDAERRDNTPNRLDLLIEEQTPGGLNEQALANLDTLGVLDAYQRTMNATFQRIQGKSDGSLEPPTSKKEDDDGD